MLVLTRRSEESIRIAGVIEIRVLEISANRVRLGISAPGHMRIWRTELVGAGPDHSRASTERRNVQRD